MKDSASPYGAVEFLEGTSQAKFEELDKNLHASGLELLGQNDNMLIDHIINTVVEVVHYSDELPNSKNLPGSLLLILRN